MFSVKRIVAVLGLVLAPLFVHGQTVPQVPQFVPGQQLTAAEMNVLVNSINNALSYPLGSSSVTTALGYTPINPGSVAITGGTIDGAVIGGSNPVSGTFSNLAANGTVSGNGFSVYLASPPAIGGTAASAGSFTNLSASGAVTGAGFSAYLASPPAIGGTAAGAGSFTSLSASGTVSGSGFSTYLASPPAIGGTTAGAGHFSTLSAAGTVSGSGFTTLLSPYLTSSTAASTYAPIAAPTFTGLVTGATEKFTGNVQFTGLNTTNTIAGAVCQDASGNLVYIAATNCVATAGSGTVTSVAAGTGITASPSPITGSGTLSITSTITAGSVGSSTSIPNLTYNAQGQLTVAGGNAVIAPAGTLSGTTLNSTVVSSSLTSVGAIATGTWNGTAVAIAHGGTGNTTASAAFNALSPITTTGDLIVGTGTNTASRLGIGSNTYVLTSNGTTAAWAAPSSGGGLLNVQVFTASGTYTPTSGTTSYVVEMVAQGGGGGGCAAGTTSTGCDAGSGSAGSYARVYFSGAPSSQTITIGTSGAGAAAGSNAGTAGSTASFGAIISCPGGLGGPAGTNLTSITGVAGTSAPAACTIASGTVLASSPGTPTPGVLSSYIYAGVFSAPGGSSPLGTGGVTPFIPSGTNSQAAGNAASGKGSGGSGGVTGGTGTAAGGGNPSGGEIIVYEY